MALLSFSFDVLLPVLVFEKVLLLVQASVEKMMSAMASEQLLLLVEKMSSAMASERMLVLVEKMMPAMASEKLLVLVEKMKSAMAPEKLLVLLEKMKPAIASEKLLVVVAIAFERLLGRVPESEKEMMHAQASEEKLKPAMAFLMF